MPRSRRNLPIVKRFIEEASPGFLDVIGGRGGGANHHPGNRRYWMKVLYSRSSYRSSKNDQEKTDIAQRIIEGIKDEGGRFVQRDGKDPEKRWFNLPNKVILAKVKQALRDQYIPLWAPVLGSKKLIDFIKAEGGQYIQYDIEDKEKQWFVFQDEERLTKVKEALQGWKIQYWVPERNKNSKPKKEGKESRPSITVMAPLPGDDSPVRHVERPLPPCLIEPDIVPPISNTLRPNLLPQEVPSEEDLVQRSVNSMSPVHQVLPETIVEREWNDPIYQQLGVSKDEESFI